jgi:hypothetical protein
MMDEIAIFRINHHLILEEITDVKRDQRQWDTDSNHMFLRLVIGGSSEYLAIIGRIFIGWYHILACNGNIRSDAQWMKNENVLHCSIEIRRIHLWRIYFVEADRCRNAKRACVHLAVSDDR